MFQFPHYFQLDIKDCEPTCVKIIAKLLSANHATSNAVVEQVSATGNVSPLLDAATTNCSVSVKYSNSPIEPEIYSGSRNWTYSEVSN